MSRVTNIQLNTWDFQFPNTGSATFKAGVWDSFHNLLASETRTLNFGVANFNLQNLSLPITVSPAYVGLELVSSTQPIFQRLTNSSPLVPSVFEWNGSSWVMFSTSERRPGFYIVTSHEILDLFSIGNPQGPGADMGAGLAWAVKFFPVSLLCSDFSFTVNGLTVNVNDTSLITPGRPITSWLWDFGDLQTSTLQNVSHTYLVSGTYLVCLKVFDGQYTNTFCKNVVVNNLCNLAADFNVNLSSGIVRPQNQGVQGNNPVRVYFNDVSSGEVVTRWSWRKRRSGTTEPFVEFSTEKNPVHDFNAYRPF